VRAALERAAGCYETYMRNTFGEFAMTSIADDFRSIASNPAEVAAIIKKAGEDRG